MSKENPDFYNKTCLADYFFEKQVVNGVEERVQVPVDRAVERATLIVKSLVEPSLASYVTPDMVKPVLLDSRKSKYKLATLANYFNNRASAKKDIASMEEWSGLVIGSRDIKARDQLLEEVRGQNYLIVMDDGKVNSFSGYGHKIGPSGEEMTVPGLSHIKVRVKPRKKKDKTYWDGKYIASHTDLPIDEVVSFLEQRAMTLDLLDPSLGPKNYSPVLVRGKIVTVQPIKNWIETDDWETVEIDGVVQYERDPNDPTKVRRDENGNPIPAMKKKVVDDGIGKPILATKADGTNKTQYVFQVMIVQDGDDNNNVVTATFQNTRLGDQFILMQDVEQMMMDAHEARPGGSDDGFAMLTSMWRGKEVIIGGTVMRVDKRQNTTYYRLDSTLVVDLTSGMTLTPPQERTVEDQRRPTEQPTKVQTMTPKVPAKTQPKPEDVIADTKPPVAEVIETPTMDIEEVETPSVSQQPEQPKTPAQRRPQVSEIDSLRAAIRRGFTNLDENITYDTLMSMRVGIPEMYAHPSQKVVVEAFMDAVRNDILNERVAAQTAAQTPEPASTEPSVIVETKTVEISAEQMTPQGIRDAIDSDQPVQPSPADIIAQTDGRMKQETEEEQQAEQKSERLPPGYIPCGICGKALAPHEVATHVCNE